jgi:hypothetical protein
LSETHDGGFRSKNYSKSGLYRRYKQMRKYIMEMKRRRERGAMRREEEGMGNWGYLNTLHFQRHGCRRLP